MGLKKSLLSGIVALVGVGGEQIEGFANLGANERGECTPVVRQTKSVELRGARNEETSAPVV